MARWQKVAEGGMVARCMVTLELIHGDSGVEVTLESMHGDGMDRRNRCMATLESRRLRNRCSDESGPCPRCRLFCWIFLWTFVEVDVMSVED